MEKLSQKQALYEAYMAYEAALAEGVSWAKRDELKTAIDRAAAKIAASVGLAA